MPQGLLYRELRDTAPHLADNLSALYRQVLDIWQEQQHRPFTAHGEPHILQVEKNLDALTRPLHAAGQSLTAEEIYVLLAACYLHDIGMQLGVPDAREEHAQYSYELVLHSFGSGARELFVRFSIPDPNAREAIAAVARAHWTSFALELPAWDFVVGNEKGRIRLLGVLLAMADLLDLSPVRARYFRSEHRLYALPVTSELHQTMHQLVKGFVIGPPDPRISGDLQFSLEWRDNSDDTRTVSDWVLHWFTSQWRQLRPVLHNDSGGAIRWATPWATAAFRPPVGDPLVLSPAVRAVLEAERAEQLRIDRDAFCQAYLRALEQKQRVLFLLPLDSEGDGARISDWCLAQARRREETRSARLDVRLADAPDLAGLVAVLVEQWGEHLRDFVEHAALLHLQQVLGSRDGFVTIAVAEEYRSELLDRLLPALFASPPGVSEAGRICVLLSPGAVGPDRLDRVEVHRPTWSEIPEADVESHLRRSWGYDDQEARECAGGATRLRLCQSPGLLYTYVEDVAKAW